MSQSHTTTSVQGGNAVIPALRRASAATGVDFEFLLQQARTESSLDPKAQAKTSSARGLFQFIEGTWLELVDKHGEKYGLSAQAAAIKRDANGKPVVADAAQRAAILRLRDDPYLAGVMAGELARENASSLQQELGREAKPGELYMAHFLGAGGAARFLDRLERNPGLNAAQVLPAAARANEGVFFKGGRALSLDEVYSRFAGKFAEGSAVATRPGLPAATNNATATQVPGAAILAAHATRLATVATLQLGSDMNSLPGGGSTEPDLALPSLPATPTHATAPVPLQRNPAGSSEQATLLALHALQSITLPGGRDAETRQRWRV